MLTVEIFKTHSNISKLQENINEFLDSMPNIKIEKILQSECENSITITIFYKPS